MESLQGLINDILADSPSPGTLYIVLSKIKENGDFNKVIKECNKALAIYPEEIRIRQILAEAYLDSGQISLAESELDRVAEQIHSRISVFRTQADIYSRQGRDEEAVKALKIYLAHCPDDESALEDLSILEPAKEVAEEKIVSEGDESLPDIATPTLAEIYLQQGQIMEAIDTYEKIVAMNPMDEQSSLRLEELKAEIKKGDEPDDSAFDRGKQAKEKMITILDTWLMNIRRQTEITA